MNRRLNILVLISIAILLVDLWGVVLQARQPAEEAVQTSEMVKV